MTEAVVAARAAVAVKAAVAVIAFVDGAVVDADVVAFNDDDDESCAKACLIKECRNEV